MKRVTHRLIWTDELRGRLARLKQAGFTHCEVAARMGLTLCQVYWGWKLCREKAPARQAVLPVDDAFIKQVSRLRRAGLSRTEAAHRLGVTVSRVDVAVSLGKKRGVDMAINARIYREKQREHGKRCASLR